MADLIEVADESFAAAVLQSDLPVLVDFWAPWCGPCHAIAPSVEKIAAEFADQLVVAKVNTDENSRTARQFGIFSIPCLVIFHRGQPIERVVGVMPYPYLRARIDNALAQAKMAETN